MLITKLKKVPSATPRLQTPKDVEINFEAHRRQLESLTNTVNALLDRIDTLEAAATPAS